VPKQLVTMLMSEFVERLPRKAAGARLTSWSQVLLELRRDWTRKDTYDGARSIVEAHAGGYGIGLSHVRDMIHSTSGRCYPSDRARRQAPGLAPTFRENTRVK
jgi:hypothetical protein